MSMRASVVTRTAPVRLRANPARDIAGMVTHPLPNTIALGGVATGSINANDAESVAGNMSISGWKPATTAVAPITGKIIVDVAVLDVSSVKKVMPKHTSKIKAHKGSDDNPAN